MKKRKYDKDLPTKMYQYFLSEVETGELPSFAKFARKVDIPLARLEQFKKNEDFDEAWRGCIEIRRDYLTDCALTRRYDSSFVKFLLSSEIEATESKDSDICVNIRVAGS